MQTTISNFSKFIKTFFLLIFIIIFLILILEIISLQRTKTVKVRTVNGKVTRTVEYK